MSIDFRAELEEYFSADDSTGQRYVWDSDLEEYTKKVMIPNKDQIPRLFRYSPADYYNISALRRKKLFLAEAGCMNDVFEGLSGAVTDDVIRNLSKLRDIAYIKSFSESANDLLMWGMYADGYAGMCVEYDLTKFSDESMYYHLFPVRYSDKRLTKANLQWAWTELAEFKHGRSEGDSPSAEWLRDLMALFVSKSKAWSREKEWRLIVTYLQMNAKADEYEDAPTEFYKVNGRLIEFPYVKAIYLGPKMPKSIKDDLKEIAAALKIKVYEMSLSPDSYELIAKESSLKKTEAEE